MTVKTLLKVIVVMVSSISEVAASQHGAPKRKLVTLRHIWGLKPLKRSRSELASIDGWKVAVPKGEYSVGDLVIYFEIDSFLPESNSKFWEYTISNGRQSYQGERGYVAKTTLHSGHISQGVVFPLLEFPEINVTKREELMRTYSGNVEKAESAMMELDYAELLGVKKYVPELDQDDGRVYGRSPIFFPQPGSDRAQNVADLFELYAQKDFVVMEKLDGISVTIYSVNTESQWYNALPRDQVSRESDRPNYGVCGRSVDYVEDKDNLIWKSVTQQAIIPKLAKIGRILGRKKGEGNFAVQGEFCGSHLLGNSMGFGPGKHHFYAFGIFDIDNQKWLSPKQTIQICQKLKIDHVPVITTCKLGTYAVDLEDLLQKAEGTGILNNNREGLIFRATDNKVTFKVIANSWLLEYGQYKATTVAAPRGFRHPAFVVIKSWRI